MNKNLICDLEKEKIIVIVRGVEEKKLVPLAQAMYNGGIKFLEITFDASAKTLDTETAQNINLLCEKFKDKMHIGAGTVLTEEQVALAKAAGGEFIISPDTDPAVIKKTKQLGMVSIPGALSPSEIKLACNSGADFVKLFPAVNLGCEYIKAVKAPLSNARFLAVGGISEENVGDYLKAGVCGFGIGANIVSKRLLEQENYDEITKLAKKYVSAVKKCQII